jgi:AcrR family transcriptional regulator
VRADARLNRERIVAAAHDALLEATVSGSGSEDPLAFEAVAARAGVGIGTLYRHFPSRHVLVEAVYGHELEEVCAAAGVLLESEPPDVALRAWMARYAIFVATKRGMGEALRVLIGDGSVTSTGTRARLTRAVTPILEAGCAAGLLREVAADDVVAAMAGAIMAAAGLDREAQVARLLDLVVQGVRRP